VFKTIKSQILLVSTSLVLLLVSQVFISRSNQATFVSSLDLTQQAVVKVSLVRKLERDVLDLQRNVLIYKESASESAIARFNLLMEETQLNLNELEELTSNDSQNEVYRDYISRMRSHLVDYQDNFSSVIIGRTERQSIYEHGLVVELDAMLQEIVDEQASEIKDNVGHPVIEKAKYHIARAENLVFQYLVVPDSEYIAPFQIQIAAAKHALSQHTAAHPNYQKIVLTLDQVESDFLQLTQVTRGYLFLMNVVMAGSANEFLFLARELNRLVTGKLALTNQEVKLTIDSTRLSSDIFSTLGIILAAATALFLAYRIMVPINIITHVFERLARGKDITSIPGLSRKDEIGKLAQAADVFQEKNKQTTTLLEQSQMLNARQEALNTELLESNKKAEQATNSKSMFLANMSHEIRTPMNGIVGLLDLVLKTKLDKTQRHHLDKVAYSSHILMSLINDILDFSKIEAGKLDIEKVKFSPHSLFSNLLANISNRAKEKNLNIRFHVNPWLPSTLIGDPLRITQVLLNICNNAIKFTRNGSVTINISHDIHDSGNGISNELMLNAEVIDTGIGMTDEQLKNVFDSFTQADGTTSRKFGGTGLGLSIVKQLVDLMNGKVSSTSQLNVGSTFKVSFNISYQAETQTNTILQDTKGKLNYYSAQRQGFVSDDYFETSGTDYHHFPISQLSLMQDKIGKEDTVIIDIADHEAYMAIRPIIRELKEKNIEIGFVTDSQPSNLPAKLGEDWPFVCLSNPYTPQQFGDFLRKLYKVEGVGQVAKDNAISRGADFDIEYEGHVLLVEDNNINQVVAGEMLKALGVSYDIAEDGQQAVTKIINSPHYDLVLMDVQMPVMDGYEATLALRESGHKELIICGLSANAMKQDYALAREAGMNEYLTKPIKQISLARMLSKYLPPKPNSSTKGQFDIND
jgi:signal transduction histidine kinase/CheY-like chemotaxis protein